MSLLQGDLAISEAQKRKDAAPIEDEPKEQKFRGRIVKDPEILAMEDIKAALYDLDEPAQRRVVVWMADRYATDKFANVTAASAAQDQK